MDLWKSVGGRLGGRVSNACQVSVFSPSPPMPSPFSPAGTRRNAQKEHAEKRRKRSGDTRRKAPGTDAEKRRKPTRFDDSFTFWTAKPRGTGTQKTRRNARQADAESGIFSICALRRKRVPQDLASCRRSVSSQVSARRDTLTPDGRQPVSLNMLLLFFSYPRLS
jgi:hypothetical protein